MVYVWVLPILKVEADLFKAENNVHVSWLQPMEVGDQSWRLSFVAVLFVDALQRMIRIAQEGAAAKVKTEMTDVRTETN